MEDFQIFQKFQTEQDWINSSYVSKGRASHSKIYYSLTLAKDPISSSDGIVRFMPPEGRAFSQQDADDVSNWINSLGVDSNEDSVACIEKIEEISSEGLEWVGQG